MQGTANKIAIVTAKDSEKQSIDTIFSKLQSSAQGLSTSEAEQRLTQFGPNALDVVKINPLAQFLGYFWGPIPWMIEAAALLSAFSGDVAYSGAITKQGEMTAIVLATGGQTFFGQTCSS